MTFEKSNFFKMINDKIKKLNKLKRILATFKKQGEKIVFTNGCFDILHLGHLRYLEQASTFGNKLVVAVNSDSSVRRLKGRLRPILPEKERAILVAALGFVDYVIVFAESSPLKLIRMLKPDVLVKGSDWHKKDIVGKNFVESYGGKVIVVDFVKGYSSSSLIAKIKKDK